MGTHLDYARCDRNTTFTIKKNQIIIQMKNLILLFSLLCTMNVMAQSTIITSTLSVKGNCDQCKERIENAADIKGVKNSSWSEKTKVMSVTYDTKKVTLEQIEKAIAKAGYSTESQKADANAYKNLPSCCKYESTDCKKK